MNNLEQWQLILGKEVASSQNILSDELLKINALLEQLYDNDSKKGDLRKSKLKLTQWLNDIRKTFSKSIVAILQKDAYEKMNLTKMLVQKEILETITPDVELLATILLLKDLIPENAYDTAKKIVQKVVDEIIAKYKLTTVNTISGNRYKPLKTSRKASNKEINWHQTILKNLKHYQPNYKTVIPEQIIFHGRKKQTLQHIIICIDQSASMASSVVYAGIFGSILTTLPSIKTNVILFDTEIVDLSDNLSDPVEMLFNTQLGGGTDINKVLNYADSLLINAKETTLIVISDLEEGGNEEAMRQKIKDFKTMGINQIFLLALNNEGTPLYDKNNAQFCTNLNIPTFACTPDLFPELIVNALERKNINDWIKEHQLL